MGRSGAGKRCAVGLAAAVLLASQGRAEAQYFLDHTGAGVPRRLRDALSVLTEAEQAVDTGHLTLGGWLLWAAGGMIEDVASWLPDADCARAASRAGIALERGDAERGRRELDGLSGELRSLGKVWDLSAAQAKCAEISALAERGDVEGARAGLAALRGSARIAPLRDPLDGAADGIAAARRELGRGRASEALASLDGAKRSLRAAVLCARLYQAKAFAAHARLMEERGAGRRARWTLGRASRRIADAGGIAPSAAADAARKIGDDIRAARGGPCSGPAAAQACAAIEAKISALMEGCRR